MDWLLKWLLPAAIGYMLGNFTTGITVGKKFGVRDIRRHGSKSAGTTNVLRTLGWLPSALTLLGDVLKGLLSALIGYWLGGEAGMLVGGTASVIGHNWPVFYGFKGGKGIATSLGFILVIEPWFALALLVCQAAVLIATHYMSVASLCSAALYFLLTLVFHHSNHAELLCAALITVLAFYTHRTNIARLLHGNENRLNFSKIKKLKDKDDIQL